MYGYNYYFCWPLSVKTPLEIKRHNYLIHENVYIINIDISNTSVDNDKTNINSHIWNYTKQNHLTVNMKSKWYFFLHSYYMFLVLNVIHSGKVLKKS